MSKRYVVFEVDDKESAPSVEDVESAVMGQFGADVNAALGEDLGHTLSESIPDDVSDNLEIIAKDCEGEKIEIDLQDVLNCLPLAYVKPVEVTSYLLKARQGICNLAYEMEDYFNRTEDAFRVWKAEQGRVLNYKDDRNPLVEDGSKTTNKAIDSYIRSQDDYEEFKNKISEIKSAKQVLWSAKKTVDIALEVVSNIRAEVLNGSEVEEETQ